MDLPAWAAPQVVAARLGQLIWDGNPDPWVLQGLGSSVTRQAAGDMAARMLTDVRARTGVTAFYRWWLLYDSAKVGDPADALTSALRAEAPALGTYLTLDANGTFTDLLTAPYTFMNETLAGHYGVQGVVGSDMRKVAFPAGELRIGLLAGAGVLSFFSSLTNPSWPAKRSWMITDPLLCTPLLRSFMPGIAPDVTRSIRQQMIDVTADATCMACHKILNSPGFAFIGFDSSGRWHPETGAAPNETEGWIPDDIMADAPRFNGPAQLARLLADREETRRCFIRQWMQFAVDRAGQVARDSSGEDGPSIETAVKAFTDSGLTLSSAIVAVTRTNTFLRP